MTAATLALDDAALALRAFALSPNAFGGLWLRGPGPARDAMVERLGHLAEAWERFEDAKPFWR